MIQGQSVPTAIHTRLDWVLSSPVWSAAELNSSTSQVSHTLHIQTTNATPPLDNLIKQFWDLESLGITQNESLFMMSLRSQFSLQMAAIK